MLMYGRNKYNVKAIILRLKINKLKRILLLSRRHRFGPWVGKILWRRKWKPTPVCLPGESHGQRSLVGYSPWGHKELDMTKATSHTHTHELWTKLENLPDFLKRGSIPTMERNGKAGRDGESLFFLPAHQDTGPGHFLNKEAEHCQTRENGHVSCHSFTQKEKK